jgi:hypothetical protein
VKLVELMKSSGLIKAATSAPDDGGAAFGGREMALTAKEAQDRSAKETSSSITLVYRGVPYTRPVKTA